MDEDKFEKYIELKSKELNKCKSDGLKSITINFFPKIKIDDMEFEINENNDYTDKLNNIFNQFYKILNEYTSSEETKKFSIIEKNLTKLNQIRRDLEKMELSTPIFIDGIGKPNKTEKVLQNLRTFKNYFISILNAIKDALALKDDINKNLQTNLNNFDKSIILFDLRNIIDDTPKEYEKNVDFSKLKKENDNLFPYISKDDNILYFYLYEYNLVMEPIIPSLYKNGKYTFNIVSFVESSLEAKIEMEESKAQKQLSKSNILEPLSPISIFFKIPGMEIEEPIEKNYIGKLKVSIKDNKKSEGSINLNFKFQFIPLKVLFNSLDNEYEWKGKKLLLLKNKINIGDFIHFNIEIMGFQPNDDFYNGKIERISLEDNEVEKPVIKINKNLFSITIPSIDNNQNKLHGLINIYITEKLFIPIEINADIINKKIYLASYDYINGSYNQNKYDLFLYKNFDLND